LNDAWQPRTTEEITVAAAALEVEVEAEADSVVEDVYLTWPAFGCVSPRLRCYHHYSSWSRPWSQDWSQEHSTPEH